MSSRSDIPRPAPDAIKEEPSEILIRGREILDRAHEVGEAIDRKVRDALTASEPAASNRPADGQDD